MQSKGYLSTYQSARRQPAMNGAAATAAATAATITVAAGHVVRGSPLALGRARHALVRRARRRAVVRVCVRGQNSSTDQTELASSWTSDRTQKGSDLDIDRVQLGTFWSPYYFAGVGRSTERAKQDDSNRMICLRSFL